MAYTSTIFEHPEARTWAVLRDFHGWARWVGRIRETVAEGGEGPGAVGSVRHVTLEPDGRRVTERLVRYDESAHSYSYEFTEPIPFPATFYRGTVALRPVTDTGHTFLEWFGEFDCEPALTEQLRTTFVGLYTEFTADLRTYLAEPPS
ncbi:MAG TPA: SRPBCC family protein [Pseudonocardia sp.]|nr:SRPBCC family protein [Pseudonocardia sp.]